MSDDVPSPPTPESGEDQYRRWIEHMKDGIRAGGAPPARSGASRGSSASAGGGADPAAPSVWSGAPTEIIERSIMPRPVVTLSQSRVDAAPGQPVRVKITVRNVGSLVETYVLSVVGPESAWLSIVPSEVSLFPGVEGKAALVIKPGRTSKLPSGDYVIGVMATSEVDPHESTVAELTIAVTPFYDSALSLSRTTLDIRRHTTTFAQVTNNGNTFIDYRLDVADPDGYLRFKVEDPEFTLGPGETVWKKVSISAPIHLFGSPRTLSMVATLNSLRDHTHDTVLEEVRPSIQRVTLVQRPAIRFRLGILGRIILLLVIIGLIAAFILSRLGMTGDPAVKTGPPPPPQGLTLQTYNGTQVLLLWDAAPGAEGYSIYAVGSTGNAVYESAAASPSASASASASASPSPSTPSSSPAPSSSAAASAASSPASSGAPTSAAPSDAVSSSVATASAAPTPAAVLAPPAEREPVAAPPSAIRFTLALARTGGDSSPSSSGEASASPASSSTSTGAASSDSSTGSGGGTPSSGSSASSSASVPEGESSAEYDIEAPSCGDCTHVADVTGGTTRYIVTKTMPGQDNCFRIIANAGQMTSLYTPRECVYVPTADEAAASASGGGSGSGTSADGSTSAAPTAACPPYLPLAEVVSESSLALTWLPPSEYKPTSSSEPSSSPSPSTTAPKKSKKARVRALRDAALSAAAKVPMGGGSTSSSPSPSGSPEGGCDTKATVTGFEVQRQLMSGWTTVSPAPAAQDSAIEVTGLQAGTKYCFRMRTLSSPTPSEYTETFCGKTSAVESTPAPTPTPAASAGPTATATPAPSASATSDPAGGGAAPSAAVVIENLRRA